MLKDSSALFVLYKIYQLNIVNFNMGAYLVSTGL